MDPEILELIERSSNFQLRILDDLERRESEYATHKSHKSILEPLLNMASDCWVYGLEKNTPLWQVSADILTPERGKHRVSVCKKTIIGKEFFWNAHSGKRGSILISVQIENIVPNQLFEKFKGVSVCTNYRSGHTPSAINFAHKIIANESKVVFCLPRNNGFEWADVFAPKPLVFELFNIALDSCGYSTA
jgi:hypothetical protein